MCGCIFFCTNLYRKVQPHYFEKQQIINKAYECTVFERYL
nr:MAG TPA: hypothetical protein [Bacteriophage sp.]